MLEQQSALGSVDGGGRRSEQFRGRLEVSTSAAIFVVEGDFEGGCGRARWGRSRSSNKFRVKG